MKTKILSTLKKQLKTNILNSKGYSTIYFSIMSIVFIGVFTLCMGALLNIMKVNEQMRQASLMSQVLLSHYDNQLEEGYGLLAYSKKNVDQASVFKPYFNENWKVTPVLTLASLKTFQIQAVALGKLSALNHSLEAIKDNAAISNTPEVDAQLESVKQKSNALKAMGASAQEYEDYEDDENDYDYDDGDRNGNKKIKKRKRSKSSYMSIEQKNRARNLKQKLNQGGKKTILIENGGEIPTEVYEKRYVFDRQNCQTMNLLDKALVTTYLFDHFNDYVQWRKTPNDRPRQKELWFEGGELEFILEGNAKAINNQLWVNGKIFATREGINLVHILKSNEKMTYTGSLATLICTLFPLGEPFVQAGLIGLWSSVESGYDLQLLLDGKDISLLKLTDLDWYTDLESEIGVEKASGQSGKLEKLNKINYRGYLRVMLMAQSDEQTALRTMTLIDLNFKKSGRPIDDWMDMVATHRIWVKGLTGKETEFEDGYLQTKRTERESKH